MGGRSVLVTLVIAAALAVPAVAAARPFYGTVGPGSTITLKRANGTTVNHASPGARKFVISDQSSGHNFHLFGPGVSKKTGDRLHRQPHVEGHAAGRHLQVPLRRASETMRGSFGVS